MSRTLARRTKRSFRVRFAEGNEKRADLIRRMRVVKGGVSQYR